MKHYQLNWTQQKLNSWFRYLTQHLTQTQSLWYRTKSTNGKWETITSSKILCIKYQNTEQREHPKSSFFYNMYSYSHNVIFKNNNDNNNNDDDSNTHNTVQNEACKKSVCMRNALTFNVMWLMQLLCTNRKQIDPNSKWNKPLRLIIDQVDSLYST